MSDRYSPLKKKKKKGGGSRGRETHNVARRRNFPVLVAPLREALDDVRLVAHQPKQTHDFLAATPDTTQHVALLGVLEDKHKLVDAVDFVFDALNERPERVRDVVDECIRYPVGRDADVVFELLDAPSHVLWMRGWPEVEL